MKKIIYALSVGIILILILDITTRQLSGKAAKVDKNVKSVVPGGSTTQKTVLKDLSEKLQWFGKVKTKNDISIKTLMSGEIKSIEARSGQAVKKGQLLFKLGGIRIDNQIKVLKNKIVILNRRIKLADKILKSQQEALALKLVTKESIVVAEDSIEKLKMERDLASGESNKIKEFSEIRSPVAGVYTGIVTSTGQRVNAGDVLGKIVSPNNLYIEATLFPECETSVLQNKKIQFKLKDKAISGKIFNILPCKNSVGATVVWISADNRAGLQIGEFVNGNVIMTVRKSALCLPEQAVVRNETGEKFIFIKHGNDYLMKKVETGMIRNKMVEIRSGLGKNDKVLIKGVYELYNKNFNKTYKVAD